MTVVTLSVLVLLGLIAMIGGLIKLNFTYDQIPPLNTTISKSLKVIPTQLEDDFLVREDTIDVSDRSTKRKKRETGNEPRGEIEKLTKVLQDIREFVQTDGHPGHPPSGGIGWIAFIVLFALLSPILIPMLLSPLILFIMYVIFVPTIFLNPEPVAGSE